jgi:hypothetical protein
MLLVKVVCSDPGCAEEGEAVVRDLDDVDASLCECGYGLVVVTVSEIDEEPRSGSLISLPDRRRAESRRAA